MSETQLAPGSQTFLSRWESGALQFSRLAALFSIGFGTMVILGWCMPVTQLAAPIPGQNPVALSTGIGFITSGLALALLTAQKVSTWMRAGALTLAMVPLFGGFCVALHYLGISKFDLDNTLMLSTVGTEAGALVGRMAPHSSMGFIAAALALLLSQHREKMARYMSQALAVSVFGLGIAVVCGYTYGTPLLYAVGDLVPVALVTGVAFVILGMGMFFARPTTGLAGVVTESGLGGRTARLLLPVALLAPIALGYLRLFGQKYDWYAMPIDTSLIVLLMGACFSLIVLWHCHFLSRITRREKAAIDALQHNEERTRLIIDRAYDAFVAMDKECKVLDWNLQAEKIFGWNRDEILGQNLSEFIIPLEFRRANETGLKAFTSTDGKTLNKRMQLVAQRKNGEQFFMELAVFPVEIDGQPTFCSFFQDISERKRIESQVELLNEQLVLARDQALEGSRLKSEFLANMSHEIRTPMNAVIGLSDLLRRTTLSRDQKRFVDLIVTSGQTLLQIIDDILVFSKIEAGRLDLENADFDLISTVESSADLLADKAREKKISLTTFLSPEIPQRVRGDSQRLKQVLLNLMSNAIKFTEEGNIVVKGELEHNTDEAVRINFSVSDTGIGISEEGKKVLFTPFTQVDGSTTRKHGGTGLGLTISKRLVELMGGSISVESTEGKGSTFTFTVPFGHGQAKYDRPLITPTSLESVRILMVGMPEAEADVAESYVESWGLRPSFATFAEEAILEVAHAIRENDPYLVILVDAQLEDAKPFEFVQRLRESAIAMNTKLLLLLSIDDIGQAENALQAGFDGTITRPIKQSSLFNSLLALFEPRAVMNQMDTLELNNASEPPSTKFVLVAEDNIVNQEVAVLLLEELGYNAHVVSNGRMALEASQDPNCQLILMDCQMPDMDGFEATMLIRQREKQSGDHVPIVAMTAHAMEGDRELCLQSGMDDYVSKPVTINRLREVVNRWLEYRESHKRVTMQSLPAISKATADSIRASEKADEGKDESTVDSDTLSDMPAPTLKSPSATIKTLFTTNRPSSVVPPRPEGSTNSFKGNKAIASSESEPVTNPGEAATPPATPPVTPPSPPLVQPMVARTDSGAVSPSLQNRESIDMTPVDDEAYEADRRFLGIGRGSRKRNDRLSRPAEDMLDDAITAATSADNLPAYNDNAAATAACSGPVGTINMSPKEALSEVDIIMQGTTGDAAYGESVDMASPMIHHSRKRYLANTVNDIEIHHLFDYNALESTFGSHSARKFLNLFASMTPSLLSRLETAINAKRFEAAKDAAHELKGMCATIHIPSMVDLCRGIEESAETSDWSNAESLLADLKRTFNQAETSIKNM